VVAPLLVLRQVLRLAALVLVLWRNHPAHPHLVELRVEVLARQLQLHLSVPQRLDLEERRRHLELPDVDLLLMLLS
jgi:hypothetical protein